eukprot:TRINITY_DN7739_c0_g1_i3.p1 TRINITY_DN7739_c0_g1~~TRINITY_DN7739_c0_g1_i3.p1  ORF type:complete len:470 (-),score=101.39 TRINITY_DN7739_c0_g1_i3:148-1557(-)
MGGFDQPNQAVVSTQSTGDILPIKDQLPLIEQEIGDVWIDGISSDPLKEIQFREISRARTECLSSGACDPNDPRIKSFSRFLIKIPEHTWGLPGVYDSANWANHLFKKARGGTNFLNCEAAWLEQRQFNLLAISALENHPLASEIRKRLAALTPSRPSTRGMTKLSNLSSVLSCPSVGKALLQFDGTTGAVISFFDGFQNWADSISSTFLRVDYTSFNESDFDYMMAYYNANAGYSKSNSSCSQPGCANPRDALWLSQMTELWWNPTNCTGFITLVSSPVAHVIYGAPELSYLQFSLSNVSTGVTLSLTLTLWNKTPTRLPEQMMVQFKLRQSLNLQWAMDKLGSFVFPNDVILNGSQYQHAVWTGFIGFNEASIVTIETPDAPLVAPITTEKPFFGWQGTPTSFPVPTRPLVGTQVVGMGVNLFNNLWDTNYILWYPYLQGVGDENLRFRFVITTQNQNNSRKLKKWL